MSMVCVYYWTLEAELAMYHLGGAAGREQVAKGVCSPFNKSM